MTRTLVKLVNEGRLSPYAGMGLIEPIMCGNGKRTFRLDQKIPHCKTAPWLD